MEKTKKEVKKKKTTKNIKKEAKSPKKTSVKKVVKKEEIVNEPKYKKYIYPSFIMGLLLSGFNYIFLIFSIYSTCYTGIYMQIFDNIVLNVLVNTTFDILLFGLSFFVVSYLFIEIVISTNK